MPDAVSLVKWRDPKSDPPSSGRMVIAWHGGDSRQLLRRGPITGQWEKPRSGTRPWNEPAPIAWADLPRPSSAVSLEDIETVLAGAMAYAVTTLDGDRKGERMEAAVARIRTALGGDGQ